MTRKKSTDEQEEYAKVWQVSQVVDTFNEYKQRNNSDNAEIKQLIKDVSNQIADKIATKEEVKTETRLIHKEYGPTKKAVWWLASAIVVIVLGYFSQLFINIAGVVGGK